MQFAHELKFLLNKVKSRFTQIETQTKFIEFFDNYKLDKDLNKIEEMIKDEMDMKLIGINPSNLFNRQIDYKNYIDENPFFSAGMFILPKGSKLPLHDHRNMLVFCKMLYGKALFNSYDKIKHLDLDLE